MVGEHFHCLPDAVGWRRISWLLPLYRRVLRARWEVQVATIQGVELGTGRAIAQAFASKKVRLPDLPTFEQLQRAQLSPEERLPAWMIEFERVNQKPPE